ncbi:TonB-dependent receptor family protein [Candidatus Omnitrophota bacterium]
MKIIFRLIFILVVITTFCSIVQAQENETLKTPEQLQKIIITPNRFSQKFKNSTGEISIITREDIENSGTEILLDVFRSIKGVIVRDYYGNGARASVDLRGFGETSSSNALVLIDGRRANIPDLSDVDWMQIPLERVERVEILHGGTGSVLYGDNAVGGVINIITKTGRTKEPSFETYASGGSYNMNKQSLSCDGATEKLSYSITTSRLDTNGYRENSEYRSSDFGTKLKYQLNNVIALKLSANYHDADLGLPGPLSDSQLHNLSRRDSVAAEENNNVGEEDSYVKFGIEGITFDIGILNVDFSFRRKTSDSFLPTWNIYTYSRIDTFAITPNYTCTLNLFGRPNKVIMGIDFYKTDNKINDFNNLTNLKTNDNDIDKHSWGLYISDSFDVTDNLAIDLGFRHERINHRLNFIDAATPANDRNSDLKRKEEAFKAGLVYMLNDDTQAFFNASKSFRSPLTDEFLYYDNTWTRQIDTGLSTQTSLGFDCGVRHAFNKYLRTDLTLFHMDINNEIYLDPVAFKNDTYEKTRHQGINFQVDLRLTNRISAFANWMYTRARFRKGAYDSNTIPMVPLNKASAGFNLGFWDNFKAIPMVTFVGRRFAISDQANAQGKLDSYVTFDLRTSYEKDNFQIFLNFNNILDRKYAEYAVYSSFNNYIGHYPSPGRNFTAGVKLEF